MLMNAPDVKPHPDKLYWAHLLPERRDAFAKDVAFHGPAGAAFHDEWAKLAEANPSYANVFLIGVMLGALAGQAGQNPVISASVNLRQSLRKYQRRPLWFRAMRGFMLWLGRTGE